jgi:hypothetical protein
MQCLKGPFRALLRLYKQTALSSPMPPICLKVVPYFTAQSIPMHTAKTADFRVFGCFNSSRAADSQINHQAAYKHRLMQHVKAQ